MAGQTYVDRHPRNRNLGYPHRPISHTIHPRSDDLHRQHTNPLGDSTLRGLEATLVQNYYGDGARETNIPNGDMYKQQANPLDELALKEVKRLIGESTTSFHGPKLGDDGKEIYGKLMDLQEKQPKPESGQNYAKPAPNEVHYKIEKHGVIGAYDDSGNRVDRFLVRYGARKNKATYQIRISVKRNKPYKDIEQDFKVSPVRPDEQETPKPKYRRGGNIIVNLPSGEQFQRNYKGDNPPQLEFPFRYWSKRHAYPNNSAQQSKPGTLEDTSQLELPLEYPIKYKAPSILSRVYKKAVGAAVAAVMGIQLLAPGVASAAETYKAVFSHDFGTLEVVGDSQAVYYRVKDDSGKTKPKAVFGQPTSGSIPYSLIKSEYERLEKGKPWYEEFSDWIEPNYRDRAIKGIINLITIGKIKGDALKKIAQGVKKETQSSSSDESVRKYKLNLNEGIADVAVRGEFTDQNKQAIEYKLGEKSASFQRNAPTDDLERKILLHLGNEERQLRGYFFKSKPGHDIYVLEQGSVFSYTSMRPKGKQEGTIVQGHVPRNDDEKTIDQKLFNSLGTRKLKALENWFKLSPFYSANDLEAMIGGMAEGLNPLFVEVYDDGGHFVGVQWRGKFATIIADNAFVSEGALGLVFNKLFDENMLFQAGAFYQLKYDAKHDALYQVVSGTLALKYKELEIFVYAGFPTSKEQKIKSHRSTKETTENTTKDGVTSKNVTSIETLEEIYRKPVELFTLNIKTNLVSLTENIALRFYGLEAVEKLKKSPLYEILEKLSLKVGGAYIGGIEGYVKESGSPTDATGKVKITREKVPSEFKFRAGLEYLIEKVQGGDLSIGYRIAVGDGKPEHLIMVSWSKSYGGAVKKEEKKEELKVAKEQDSKQAQEIVAKGPETKEEKKPRLNEPAQIEDIAIKQFEQKRETEKKNISFTHNCKEDGEEGVNYTCTVTAGGTDFTVYNLPSFLSGTKDGEHKFNIEGTPGFDASGNHPIKIGIKGKNQVEGFAEWTLKIKDVPRNPTAKIDSPSNNTTITAGQNVTLESTIKDPAGTPKSIEWIITKVSGGPAPAIPKIEDPGSITFSNAGVYDASVKVTGQEATAESGKVRINVNEATSVSAPTVNLKVNNLDGPVTVADQTTITLSYTVGNSPTSCTASNGWSGSKSTGGASEQVGPLSGSTSITYTITCTNAGGSISDSVVVNVASPVAPTISINDVTITEGNSGTTNATFTATLSASTTRDVSMSFSTAGNTATSGTDFVANSGTLTISAGQSTGTITIQVNGDTLFENDESFFVNLSNATLSGNGGSLTFSDTQGTGTIQNDDSQPSLSINDVSATEGNSGTKNFVFTVTQSSASGLNTTVNFATANGTATAGSDYVANSGTVTISAGSTSATITVVVNGDTDVESDETFFVNLSGAVNATISDTQGQGTIQNDDAAPPPPGGI